MFFSDQVMGKGGPLSAIWLASHWEKKVSKSQFLLTNIESSVHAIVDTNEPIAIRVSGQLLLGVVKIYSKKAKYLLEDCGEALVKIKMAFRSGQVDLNLEQQVVSASAITMHENMNEFDILLPEPGFTRPLVPKEDVTMIDTFLPSFQEEVGRDQSLEPQIGRDAPETSFLQLETPQKPQDPLLFEEGAVDFGFDQMDAPIEESFQMDIDQPGDLVIEKTPKPKKPKKRKLIVDRSIELAPEQFRNQLHDAQDISKQIELVPLDRLQLRKMDIQILGLDAFSIMPSFIPIEFQAFFGSTVVLDQFEEIPFEEDHKRLKTDETLLQDSFVDEPSFIAPPEFIEEYEEPMKKIQAIDLLRDKEKVKFSELTQNATKASAASLFFELLVLGTKDMIQVHQQEPYDDITVIPKNLIEP